MTCGFSPEKAKRRILSNSVFWPVARLTTATLFCTGRRCCRRRRASRSLGYIVNATNFESPEIASVAGAAAAPKGFGAPDGGSPMEKRCSVAPAAVWRTTTVASPSLGDRTYANHFPSLETTGVRIDFQALRSAAVICLPPVARVTLDVAAASGCWAGADDTANISAATDSVE